MCRRGNRTVTARATKTLSRGEGPMRDVTGVSRRRGAVAAQALIDALAAWEAAWFRGGR